jgi:hypothetical protein
LGLSFTLIENLTDRNPIVSRWIQTLDENPVSRIPGGEVTQVGSAAAQAGGPHEAMPLTTGVFGKAFIGET